MLIRKAKASDVDVIFELMQELAKHENVLEYFTCKKEDLKKLLSENFAQALLVELDNKIIALALFYITFVSFSGKKGLRLEVFYVKDEYRKKGVGKALFKALNEECLKNDYKNLEFICINSNTQGYDFYSKTCKLNPIDYTYKTFVLEKNDMQKMLELL